MIFHILSPKKTDSLSLCLKGFQGWGVVKFLNLNTAVCALTENPAIWQWPDPLGIRRVGRPLKVISSLSSSIAAKVRAKGIWLSISLSAPLAHTAQFLMSWPCLLLNTQLGQGFYSIHIKVSLRTSSARPCSLKECRTMVQALKPPFGVDRLHELELLGF